MRKGGFSERERAQLWFEEERESGVRVVRIRRVEREVSRDDERGVVRGAKEASA